VRLPFQKRVLSAVDILLFTINEHAICVFTTAPLKKGASKLCVLVIGVRIPRTYYRILSLYATSSGPLQ
jgi:hypothetical protein